MFSVLAVSSSTALCPRHSPSTGSANVVTELQNSADPVRPSCLNGRVRRMHTLFGHGSRLEGSNKIPACGVVEQAWLRVYWSESPSGALLPLNHS